MAGLFDMWRQQGWDPKNPQTLIDILRGPNNPNRNDAILGGLGSPDNPNRNDAILSRLMPPGAASSSAPSPTPSGGTDAVGSAPNSTAQPVLAGPAGPTGFIRFDASGQPLANIPGPHIHDFGTDASGQPLAAPPNLPLSASTLAALADPNSINPAFHFTGGAPNFSQIQQLADLWGMPHDRAQAFTDMVAHRGIIPA